MDTLFNIPYDAWGASLTPVYREKSSVWVTRQILQSAGILFGMAVVPLVLFTEQCTSTPDDGCMQAPLGTRTSTTKALSSDSCLLHRNTS